MPKRKSKNQGQRFLDQIKDGAKSAKERIAPLAKVKRKSIMINVACYKTPHPQTMMAVQNLMHHFQSFEMGIDILYRMNTASDVTAMRNDSLADWDNMPNCIGALYIDDDMMFNVGGGKSGKGDNVHGFNPLQRLLMRDKDIIGALCTTRQMPIRTNAGYQADDGNAHQLTDPELITPMNATPFEVDYLGFGFIYIQRRAILKMLHHLKIPANKLFDAEVMWHYLPDADKSLDQILLGLAARGIPRTRDAIKKQIDLFMRRAVHMSEDWSFCRKAKESGCEVWVDPSFEVQHIGDYPYSRMDWLAQDEEVKRQREEREKEERKLKIAEGG